jgi:hypothetical protein
MFCLSRQYVRSVAFGLMLLLTVGIGPACLVDDDGDDETPAVAIELNTALPSNKALHLPKGQASGWIKSSSFEPGKLSASIGSSVARGSESSSLPLIVPLRT